MSKKGRKRIKGEPALYEEMKGRVNVSLTPKAVSGLDELATQMGLKRSELIEMIGRKAFTVIPIQLSDPDLGKLSQHSRVSSA
ncbi:ribbon-helix-helix domain-containing protein [Coleofasciculus sp.]|uniref:ribbon-helix-helix domain-containing protein n=1 Tax=Coleofasciculus sp. TaxID=3100458 RepID=UPI003A3F0E71